MTIRFRTGILAFLSVSLIGLGGCGDDDSTADKTPGATAALGVMQAENGSIVTRGDRSVLTLSQVKPRVVVFSDRPRRVAGTVGAGDLVDNWTRAFGDDPPNAALVQVGSASRGKPIVLELSSPEFEQGEVTFTAETVDGSGDDLLANPERLGPATLFIDDGGMMQLVAYGSQDV